MADTIPTPPTTRDEKRRALAALVGPNTLARLQASGLGDVMGEADADQRDDTPPNVAPDRLAWHQNRLLKRLRARLDAPVDAPKSEGPAPSPVQARLNPGAIARPPSPGHSRIDARIAGALDPTRLAGEHPAVLAHILQGMDRAARVDMLRALPGHTARAAIRRMRDRGIGL